MPLLRTLPAALCALLALALAAPAAHGAAAVQPFLAGQLERAGLTDPVSVAVHGTDVAAARSAVRASGLGLVETFDRVGVAIAVGTPAQVRAAGAQPGVTYLEGNRRLEHTLATSNLATGGLGARLADGTALTGEGVSVAVIDSGVDGTHPFFREADGSSAVVRNLKYGCGALIVPAVPNRCLVDSPVNDTDTTAVGGHGTHVAGIVAGRPTEIDGGARTVQGAAPGAKVVSLSTGAVLFVFGADSALNWVLDNHRAPCGAGVSATECPPIRATNNSYGPSGGGEFDPNGTTAKLQRALAADGVLTVWAQGNDGGDGAENLSNPAAQDPTGGVIGVAAYDDLATGTRAGTIADFSSRGDATRQSTWPDVAAPGANIESACRLHLPICGTGFAPVDGGDYNTISGTSMAAPHVAGIVAQLAQARPAASAAAIEDAIVQTAHRFTSGAPYATDATRGGLTSFDKGHGLVDVPAAVSRLTGTATTTTTTTKRAKAPRARG